jgi:hypothetical protein
VSRFKINNFPIKKRLERKRETDATISPEKAKGKTGLPRHEERRENGQAALVYWTLPRRVSRRV